LSELLRISSVRGTSVERPGPPVASSSDFVMLTSVDTDVELLLSSAISRRKFVVHFVFAAGRNTEIVVMTFITMLIESC
jgi:hypothetical protein